MQKKLTSHCPQCPSEDDHSATCGLPTTSICLEAVKKNSSHSLKDWRKLLLVMAWKSTPTKQNSCQQDQAKTIYQHTDEWNNARRSGPRIHTNQRPNINQVKIRLVPAHLAMTSLAILWKNNAIIFPSKIKLYKHLSCQYCFLDVRAGH